MSKQSEAMEIDAGKVCEHGERCAEGFVIAVRPALHLEPDTDVPYS